MNNKNKNLRKAKMLLNEQIKEKKLNKKIENSLEVKVASHSYALKYSVLNKGIKNQYEKAKNAFLDAKENYKKSKNKENRKNIDKARNLYIIEKKNINSEVKQINKLNKISKGIIKRQIPNDIAIKLEHVRKIYAQKGMIFEALKDINLEFKKGSLNVILGESGSGKTTLLNMISGLDRATSGIVNINGTNIQALSTNQITQFRRHNIGFVFQSYNLLSSLNVNDNIEIGRSLQTKTKLRKDIGTLLDQMNMHHNRKKMTYELSGGQQQRVSIARALAKTPNILIGDEPTGALDHATTKKVFNLFQEINKKYNTTIIIVTHNPEVAKMGHQVIHVKDGKIDSIIYNESPKSALQLFN